MHVFLFRHPTPLSFGHSCVPMNTNLFNILWFSSQGKSRDIVKQSTCWCSWLIFVQHGLFGIQLIVYSALLRLTDHGIYYITRCGIWLSTIFHIPYIHFQRELRKVTPPNWYLSFFVQYTCKILYVSNAGLLHRSACYYYGYNANATWKEANFSCWEMGLRLAVFDTVEEWYYAMYHVGQFDLSFNM